jgi:hypothetical protein
LTALGVAASDGFETEIQLAHAPTHVAVEPLDDVSGRALSRSAVVAVGA